ncbi:MAG: 50S ribosomal protein L17 [Candidatus Latescibacterota bacterium]|nr:MAG: 50S ribosomal protein L17 [Candidatus Latescibacterota bacterium]
MRHRVDHRKLGRTRSHRKAMLANMVTSLFDKERIQTTDAKAKEARRQAEKLITRAKKGYAAYKEHQTLKEAGKDVEAKQMQAVALGHWRVASRVVRKKAVLKKLFDEIAPQYMEREGGYTRILHLGVRLGDNARTVILELVESEKASEKSKRRGRRKADEEKAAKPKRKKAAKPKKEKEEKEEAKAEVAEAKAEGKAKAEVAEAKAEEKAKAEPAEKVEEDADAKAEGEKEGSKGEK